MPPKISYRYPDLDNEVDHRSRGWRQGILVELEDGRSFELEAYDPTRLMQDIDLEIRSGASVFVQPHIIVVPEVTDDAVRTAIRKLAEGGWFFDQISPRKT